VIAVSLARTGPLRRCEPPTTGLPDG